MCTHVSSLGLGKSPGATPSAKMSTEIDYIRWYPSCLVLNSDYWTHQTSLLNRNSGFGHAVLLFKLCVSRLSA
jgi:hypothetical protein